MTPKRRAFARALIEGSNPSDAYRLAYSTAGMSAKSIANEANKLKQDPEVSRMVSDGEKRAMENSVWNRAMAIERLEDVNLKCYQALMGGIDRDAMNGFMETTRELDSLCNVSAEVAEDYQTRFQTKEKLIEAARRSQMASDAQFEAFAASF